MVLWNGPGVFWPYAVAEVELADGKKLLGEILQTEINPETGVESVKFKVGNMEDGPAFRWIETNTIRSTAYPADAFVLERVTNMNFYGFLEKVVVPGFDLSKEGNPRERLSSALTAARNEFAGVVSPLQAEQDALAEELKNNIKYAILRINYQRKQLLAAGREKSIALVDIVRFYCPNQMGNIGLQVA